MFVERHARGRDRSKGNASRLPCQHSIPASPRQNTDWARVVRRSCPRLVEQRDLQTHRPTTTRPPKARGSTLASMTEQTRSRHTSRVVNPALDSTLFVAFCLEEGRERQVGESARTSSRREARWSIRFPPRSCGRLSWCQSANRTHVDTNSVLGLVSPSQGPSQWRRGPRAAVEPLVLVSKSVGRVESGGEKRCGRRPCPASNREGSSRDACRAAARALSAQLAQAVLVRRERKAENASRRVGRVLWGSRTTARTLESSRPFSRVKTTR